MPLNKPKGTREPGSVGALADGEGGVPTDAEASNRERQGYRL